MTTRDELEKEAKKVGVPAPAELPTAQDVKQETDVATAKKDRYFYPEHGITVVAKDREEADNKLKKALKDRQ